MNGAPQAGEKFKVYEDEAEAKEIAYKRAQILREQGIRTKKHITLDEIGRRLALGNFKELNVIIKGDVDGSLCGCPARGVFELFLYATSFASAHLHTPEFFSCLRGTI